MTDNIYDITDTARNLELLGDDKPNSGRVIKEDGSVINKAEAINGTTTPTITLLIN